MEKRFAMLRLSNAGALYDAQAEYCRSAVGCLGRPGVQVKQRALNITEDLRCSHEFLGDASRPGVQTWSSGEAKSLDNHGKPRILGEAPFMGHEPLGLPPSGKVHIWLPWPAQRTLRPETWHAGQANLFSQPCDVRGANGAICKVLLLTVAPLAHTACTYCGQHEHNACSKLANNAHSNACSNACNKAHSNACSNEHSNACSNARNNFALMMHYIHTCMCIMASSHAVLGIVPLAT
eukprot:1161410-Pelagomonas_calceolata.AAC.8